MRIKKIGNVLVKVTENFIFMKDLKRNKHISERRLYTIKDGNKRYLVKSKY
jgi:hypothetical protein